jgi:hypothetical protein
MTSASASASTDAAIAPVASTSGASTDDARRRPRPPARRAARPNAITAGAPAIWNAIPSPERPDEARLGTTTPNSSGPAA